MSISLYKLRFNEKYNCSISVSIFNTYVRPPIPYWVRNISLVVLGHDLFVSMTKPCLDSSICRWYMLKN